MHLAFFSIRVARLHAFLRLLAVAGVRLAAMALAVGIRVALALLTPGSPLITTRQHLIDVSVEDGLALLLGCGEILINALVHAGSAGFMHRPAQALPLFVGQVVAAHHLPEIRPGSVLQLSGGCAPRFVIERQ